MTGYRPVFWIAILTAVFSMVGLAPFSASGQSQAESLSTSFRKAAERVAPSVVAIRPIDPIFPGISGTIRPFGTGPRFSNRIIEDEVKPLGSGVVIDADRGQILTNDHLLQGASRVAVVLVDGRERQASQIRRDAASNLAVLIVDPNGLNLTAARWGDAAALRPGDWVLTIGQPGGSAPSLSSGIFSARRRGMMPLAPAEEWLETDAAVNALNSGGPLVNLAGEVVGINTEPVNPRAGVAGLGFAFPADRARRIAADLIAFGRARRAFLGVQIEPVTRPLSDRPVPPGSVVIASVTAGTPAAAAGLRPGDLIVSIAGRPAAGVTMLQEMIETAPIGEDLTLTIERGGRRQEIVVRPQPRPDGLSVGPTSSVLRPPVETRRDALRGRPRAPAARVVPREPPPLPTPPAGDDLPSSLDPILVKPTRPESAPPPPPLESPKNQPEENQL